MKNNIISRKIVASIIFICIVIILTISSFVVIYLDCNNECYKTIVKDTNFSDFRIQSIVDSYTETIETMSKLLDSSKELKSEKTAQTIQNLKLNYIFSPLRLYCEDGYAVTEDKIYDDISPLVKFEDIYSEKKYLSVVGEDTIGNKGLVMNYYFPFVTKDNIRYVFDVVVEMSKMRTFSKQSGKNGEYIILLLDRRNNEFILNYPEEGINRIEDYKLYGFSGDVSSYNDFMSNINGCHSIMFVTIRDGKRNFYYSCPSQVDNWTVFVKMDEKVFLSKIIILRRVFLFLFLTVFILFIGYLFWVFRDIKRQIKEESHEYSEIAKALSMSYDGIYYVDTKNNRYKEFSSKGVLSRLNIQTTGTDFFWESYINLKKIGYEEDLPLLEEFLNKDRLLKSLKKGEFTSAAYRLIINDIPQFYRLKVMLSHTDNHHIIVASENVNEEVKKEQNLQDRTLSLIRALNGDYEIVYYIDPETGKYERYGANDKFEKNVLPSMQLGTNFFEDCFINILRLASKEDRPLLKKFYTKENIKKALDENKEYSIDSRVIIDGKIEWYRDKIIKLKDLTGKEKWVLGVMNISGEKLQDLEKQRNIEIISVLASEFSSVYYLDLEFDSVTPYTMNENTQSKFGKFIKSNVKYSEAFKTYVDSFIFLEDKEKVLKAGSIEEIKSNLKKQKTYVTTYRSKEKQNNHYCEMKFVKMNSEEEEPTAVVLAFADKDEEILTRFVDNKLYDNYIAIYFANLDTNTVRTVREKENKQIGDFERYSDKVSYITQNVDSEYINVWKAFENPEKMKEFLAVEDKREFTFKTKKGEWRRVSAFVVERNKNKPVNIIFALSYIDSETSQKIEYDRQIAIQKKKLESQQLLLEKALENSQVANKAKTVFLNNMSHDIRTPMNAIMGFATLAIKDYNDSKKVFDYLGKIKVSSTHLLDLINDVLDMSRIEAGKVAIHEKIENLEEVVLSIKELISSDIREKNQKLSINTDKLVHKNVMCDKLRLNQILLNVLSNAIKYTDESGKISVKVSELKMLSPEYSIYEFRVKDNGIGMSKDFVDTIFDPFTRERSSTISGVEGTGLGMAITKTLIEMMAGQIEIRSQENIGTEIIIKIPFKPMEEKIESVQKEKYSIKEKYDIRGMKILLVDDNDFNREIARILLQDEGCVVQEAVNGLEAVNIVKKSNPKDIDVVLMDVQMPVMDGYEATRKIRELANKKLASLPVIAMTANAFDEDRKDALASGMNEHLGKPIDVNSMCEVISKFK